MVTGPFNNCSNKIVNTQNSTIINNTDIKENGPPQLYGYKCPYTIK